jgi:hypothetical protein
VLPDRSRDRKAGAPNRGEHGHLRSFMLLGFGTGLVLVLWSYF